MDLNYSGNDIAKRQKYSVGAPFRPRSRAPENMPWRAVD